MTAAVRDEDWVLVTGATRGIGRAVAFALAEAGYPLVLWARTGRELEEIAAEITAKHGTPVRIASVDVSVAAEVDKAVADSLAGIATLRGAVINAGGGIWSSIEEMAVEDWRAVVGTNLDGAFHTLRVAMPLLRGHRGAQLVGLASDSSYGSFPQRGAYCASKAGFRSLLETARRELRESGVRVTVLVPSRVDTYFRGKQPGDRPEALSRTEVAEVVTTLFAMGPRVEVREVQLSSIHSSFGPFPEVAPEELTDV
ncbi:SDR family oxidoreductase [Streptomyces hygroscopicus]|uniref:SDR family oxidoreductase n=1 Tax=Streptomyces hygroscopicus TaxID=1912 RepID=UPI0008268776|nr:SDR family NAD(P)-dependent oxidoreductase [Streptomyces hygroscopicus]MBW8089235.1 SDR family NAD(P)-dependent oxidoreductase [Streptomyces hygroscopicus subsp. hygroscopicus]